MWHARTARIGDREKVPYYYDVRPNSNVALVKTSLDVESEIE